MWECRERHCGQRLLQAAAPRGALPVRPSMGISPWGWEAQPSKCIWPETPGSGWCRSSPSLKWDTSLHWEEGPGAGVSGVLPEQGWEWDKERCWHGGRGTHGEREHGKDLAGFAGGTSLGTDLEPSGCEGEERPLKAGGFGKHFSYCGATCLPGSELRAGKAESPQHRSVPGVASQQRQSRKLAIS